MAPNSILLCAQISDFPRHPQRGFLQLQMGTFAETHSQRLYGGEAHLEAFIKSLPSKLRELLGREVGRF